MSSDYYEPLDVAIRVYATRQSEASERRTPTKRRRSKKHRQPQRTIVFDTETTTDASQRLNFGAWRYYIDPFDALPGTTCVHEGLVYADDLPTRDPEGFASLYRYVEKHQAEVAPGFDTRLRLCSRSEFVEEIIHRRGLEQHATIVGFNLAFDLSRLAVGSGKARGRFLGGHSLKLFDNERYRSRITYKAIDSKRTLFGLTKHSGPESKGDGFRGSFVDARTLAFALTNDSLSLERACKAFGVDYTKREVTHGFITEDYVTYCREDVAATASLFQAEVTEFRRHPIDLDVTRAFSPASIGKSYLGAMGVKPPLERQPDFDRAVLGRAMAAYFGGRAECRIRKVALPVLYVDFVSMYPTVNVLMKTWELLTARRIAVVDSTEAVRKLLAAPDLLEHCLDPVFWPQLQCLVEIEPDGELLPVRARYDPAHDDFGIGINRFRSSERAWYTLPDVVVALILGGKAPKVLRAISFRAVGEQAGLMPIQLRGAVKMDPRSEDFFKRLIEERHGVRHDEALPPEEWERLTAFLKVLANSTSYGIFAEMNRQKLTKSVTVTVHSDRDEPFATRTTAPEDPGRYFFSPIAACSTGAARLMLAILERLVAGAGGSYVFCDTDSMAIVADSDGGIHQCPGGTSQLDDGTLAVRALTLDQANAIVELFSTLNPYNPSAVPGSILKIEDENFDNGEFRQIWCYAISAKRYALFAGSVDDPALVKWSEHGLGHLLNPTDPDSDSRDWIQESWRYLLARELGQEPDEPPLLDRSALTRVTASGPAVLSWFAGMNAGLPYDDQVKPSNFLMLAQLAPLDASGLRPVAPYESDPSKWMDLPWIDRGTGNRIQVTTEPATGDIRPRTATLRTYRDVFAEYAWHPEAKSLGPDGKFAGRRAVGLLRRRSVEIAPPLHLIGKEGNKIDQRLSGEICEPGGYRTEYVNPSRDYWMDVALPALRALDKHELARRSGLHLRTIERILNGRIRPRPQHQNLLKAVAMQK